MSCRIFTIGNYNRDNIIKYKLLNRKMKFLLNVSIEILTNDHINVLINDYFDGIIFDNISNITQLFKVNDFIQTIQYMQFKIPFEYYIHVTIDNNISIILNRLEINNITGIITDKTDSKLEILSIRNPLNIINYKTINNEYYDNVINIIDSYCQVSSTLSAI